MIISYRNLFVIALVKNVTRFGVGRLQMLYKTSICYLFDHDLSRDVGGFKKTRFVLVKLENHLYIRHDGVLNAFQN